MRDQKTQLLPISDLVHSWLVIVECTNNAIIKYEECGGDITTGPQQDPTEIFVQFFGEAGSLTLVQNVKDDSFHFQFLC